jgi:hypothetical protein
MSAALEIIKILSFIALGALSSVVAGALLEIIRARLDRERWEVLRSRSFSQNVRVLLS